MSDAAFTVVGEVSAPDPCLYEQIVRPWELANTPLAPGVFGYRMHYMQTPAVTFYREQFDLACRVQGLSPPNVFAFSVPLRLGTRSNYWNAPLHESALPAMLPGGLDAELSACQDHLVVLVDLSLLHRHLPEELCDGLKRAASNHLLPAGKEAVKNLGNWLLTLLYKANQQPNLLQNRTTIQSIEEELLARLTVAIQVSPAPHSPAPLSKRRRGLNRALEFLREVGVTSVTIPEISKAAGVSVRTLEYAFRETFDLTPLGYLRLQRLHTARRELMAAAPPHRTNVSEIAMNAGFYHVARFAENYRRIFGELPSQTLKKQYTHIEDELCPLIKARTCGDVGRKL